MKYLLGKNLNVRYHLEFVKYNIFLNIQQV